MGKKKEEQRRAKSNADFKAPARETKEQKSYSFAADKAVDVTAAKEDVVKVQLDSKLEAAMLDLIRKARKDFQATRSVSHRLTTKKLTDLYQSLVDVGFKRKQVEDAMLYTVPYGQDLLDCLDWLCLNTNNDELPEGFSQALHKEELKLRPKIPDLSSDPAVTSISVPVMLEQRNPKVQQENVKDWILSRYAEQTSEDDEDEDKADETSQTFDPSERYLELIAKMLDLKVQSKEAKRANNEPTVRDFSRQISKIVSEIDEVKKLRGFDPEVIVSVSDDESSSVVEKAAAVKAKDKKKNGEEPRLDDLCSSLEMFEENALKTKPTVKTSKEVVRRSFEYTRQQWTGKSPKQFLNDWVRKHLPQSSSLSFEQVPVGGGLWKARCKLTRKSKEGNLIVCPDIACGNMKEAEHLASTLALYQLCRGQNIQMLLPPPYRDVWIEWLRAEELVKKEAVEEDNRPREEFVGRLLKMLKASDSCVNSGGTAVSHRHGDVKDSWEDVSSAEEEEDDDDSAVHDVVYQRTNASDHIFDVRPIFSHNQKTVQYQTLLEERRHLPAFQAKERIVEMLQRTNVFIVAGETGCGKSTQVPQFILETFLFNNKSATNQLVVCTQPRRISAISLASRVSAELGENGPGKHNSVCGYQIRFEKKRCRSTRLLYCTTGIILRLLQDDSYLSNVCCVIVDEVHERSVESDFLLINLKHLALVRPELRVVLMSATLDSEKFSRYFDHCAVIEIAGRTFPVEVFHLEDVIEKTGYQLDEGSPYALRPDEVIEEESKQVEVSGQKGATKTVQLTWTREDFLKIDLSGLDPMKYSLRTRNVVSRLNADRINIDLIFDLLTYINSATEFCSVEGAILVFLPGLSHIQELNDLLLADREFGNANRYRILALHSIISSRNQSVAFSVPPKGVRKIVMATNIAETGITIPDVVFVIDSGKEKENRYLETSRMSQLQEIFVSKASAQQRCGRAGRVREGICFRLYTSQRFDSFPQYSVPEMLRVPLEQLCLHIMKCQLGRPEEFLSKAISQPSPQAVSKAMSILREVGACQRNEAVLTPLGHFLALLPIDVHLGKMLVYGALLGCLEPAAVIAASMADKSPFVAPIEKRDMADAIRMQVALDNSDHLTLYNAFLGWKAAGRQGFIADRKYCDQNFLRRTSLIDIENVSQDLIKMMRSAGLDVDLSKLLSSTRSKQLLPAFQPPRSKTNDQSLSPGLLATLRAVITAGLYPNVARLSYVEPIDRAARTAKVVCSGRTPQGVFQVHPGSVNRYLAANGWLVFQEKVKYSQVFLRDSTHVGNIPILLFGGDVEVQHLQQLVTVDDWIKFKAPAKTGVLFKEMRLLIDQFLQLKLRNPQLDVSEHPLIPILLELLVSETDKKIG